LLPDLERLIALQRIETDRVGVARVVHEVPQRQAALDERAAGSRAAFAEARARHEAVAAAKRDAEKEMAAAESRLSKFRDQQQNVKTNKEYQAMLHEIDTAKADVDKWQEQVLMKMDEIDEAAAALKAAEAALKTAEAEIAGAKRALDAERSEAESKLAGLDAERAKIAATIDDPRALIIFEGHAKQRRTGVVQAVDGLCTECRVRLRPQVFSEIRRNDQIRQCDNCQRIVYYVPPPAAPDAPAATAPPAPGNDTPPA
jgi:predicted  nucleic acid-binding Zn-ribbon protein